MDQRSIEGYVIAIDDKIKKLKADKLAFICSAYPVGSLWTYKDVEVQVIGYDENTCNPIVSNETGIVEYDARIRLYEVDNTGYKKE